MAAIDDVFSRKTDQGDIINELKSKRYSDQPDVKKAKKQINPLEHDVFDKILRPDKRVKVQATETTANTTTVIGEGETTGERIERVARIGLAIQQLIVKRAVSFLFGNEVVLNAEAKTDKEKQVVFALKRILRDNKSSSLHRRVARQVLSSKEAAVLFFPLSVDKTDTGSKLKDFLNNIIGNKYHILYGFKSKYKLRTAIFSPLLGDTLWPYFDETGDMLAFSREYERTDEDKKNHSYFETYTNSQHFLWEHASEGWMLMEGYPRKIEIGKIPIVYVPQDKFEWEDVQGLIDRLEKLLSNFADTNDYHASPKILVKGEVKGFGKKGESGQIIEIDENGDAKYLAWEQAPESVKLEIETLLKMIYTLTQTPDISFESVKGIGAVSGIALKLLFMDAHLKVKDHQEVFDDYLTRSINIIKAFISKFNTGLAEECETLEIEPEIKPFMIEDEKSVIEVLTMANGNKPLISKKLAAELSHLAKDPEKDFKQMEAEAKAESYTDINEPTI